MVDVRGAYEKPFEASITGLVLPVRRPRDGLSIELQLELVEWRALLMLIPLADEKMRREEARRRGDIRAMDVERGLDGKRSHDERYKRADMAS